MRLHAHLSKLRVDEVGVATDLFGDSRVLMIQVPLVPMLLHIRVLHGQCQTVELISETIWTHGLCNVKRMQYRVQI